MLEQIKSKLSPKCFDSVQNRFEPIEGQGINLKHMLKYFSTLSVTQYFTVDFICPYNMNHYPFDIQECNGTLEPKTNSDFFVKLVPKYLNYLGPTDLMKYQLEKNVSFVKSDNVSIFFYKCLQLLNYTLSIIINYALIIGKSFYHFPTNNGKADIE